MKDITNLIGKIALRAVGSSKPVTSQTGVMENATEVRLDPQLTVNATLPKKFTEGIKVSVDGTLNGEHVSGELTIKQELKAGDLVKVVREDGRRGGYYVTGEI